MNYKSFNLGDWIGHISGVIEDESTLDGNEMRDLVLFLTTLKQEPTTKNDLEDFARWVAEEIIDEEMWEYNHQSFAELACRKLVKLGIMQESKGEYNLPLCEDVIHGDFTGVMDKGNK